MSFHCIGYQEGLRFPISFQRQYPEIHVDTIAAEDKLDEGTRP